MSGKIRGAILAPFGLVVAVVVVIVIAAVGLFDKLLREDPVVDYRDQ